MCPSYMATREEKHTTRARANILRHTLTHPRDALKPFDSDEVKEVMDLCLSCKGCKSECPSNVDIAKLKAEFLQHYYDEHGVPLRSRMIANFTLFQKMVDPAPWAWNLLFGTAPIRRILNNLNGFHPDRTIPMRHSTTVTRWHKKNSAKTSESATASTAPKRKVYLFCDEFTEYNDVPVGQKAIKLLQRLGYEVVIPKHGESARTWLSKGLIRKAATIAKANVELLSPARHRRGPARRHRALGHPWVP